MTSLNPRRFSNQDNQFQGELTALQPEALPKPVIVVASNTSNPANPSIPFNTGGLVPVLMYGGVAVAVIIAIAYFSQVQLKSINKLMKTVKKKNK
ncbi:MAG: hypothetical protein F6J96_33125 [Symploca sp. SIO1C2]|nr:hypothetical protein [Symploca sp. SIO1C2]